MSRPVGPDRHAAVADPAPARPAPRVPASPARSGAPRSATALALLVLVHLALTAAIAGSLVPDPMRVLAGIHLAVLATGLVWVLALGLPVRSSEAVIAVPAISWASTMVTSLPLWLAGIPFSPITIGFALCAVQALAPVAVAVRGHRPPGHPAPALADVAARAARAIGPPRRAAKIALAAGVVAGALVVALGWQAPQPGNPWSILALERPRDDAPDLSVARGETVGVPVALTSSRPLPTTSVRVWLGTRRLGTQSLPSVGPGRARGPVTLTAPTRPGRYRLTIRAANPTHAGPPPPADPARATGPSAEAQASARELSVTLWLVVR